MLAAWLSKWGNIFLLTLIMWEEHAHTLVCGELQHTSKTSRHTNRQNKYLINIHGRLDCDRYMGQGVAQGKDRMGGYYHTKICGFDARSGVPAKDQMRVLPHSDLWLWCETGCASQGSNGGTTTLRSVAFDARLGVQAKDRTQVLLHSDQWPLMRDWVWNGRRV